MAKVLQIGAANGTLAGGNAHALPIAGPSNSVTSSLAARIKIRFYAAGTISNFSFRVTANTDTNAVTLTLKKNASVSGNQSISIGAGATGLYEDASNTDAVTANDDWYIESSTVTSTKSISYSGTSFVFDATTDTTTKVASFAGGTGFANPTASSTTYAQLVTSSLTSSEAIVQSKVKAAGTLKGMYVNVYTNTRSSTTTVGMRVNAASGSIVVSIPTVTTGVFEDTTHTDSVSSGNLINYYVTAGAL